MKEGLKQNTTAVESEICYEIVSFIHEREHGPIKSLTTWLTKQDLNSDNVKWYGKSFSRPYTHMKSNSQLIAVDERRANFLQENNS